MAQSVWLVERGEYSDYGVLAIFATEEQANEFSSHAPRSAVREWVLNTWVEEDSEFEFLFDLDGNITEVTEDAYIDPPLTVDDVRTSRLARDEIRVLVHRGPRERAIKIASERYTRIRAFLDMADAMVERAVYRKIGPPHEFDTAVQVAEILAGLRPVPDSAVEPLCQHERDILTILGIAEESAQPSHAG